MLPPPISLALRNICHPHRYTRMASIARLAAFQRLPPMPATTTMVIRTIKTTKKKDDHHIEIYDPEYVDKQKPKGPETAQEFADVSSQKNWISFGYDYVDKKEDRHQANIFFFSYFTIGFMLLCYVFYYYPYMDGYDWALREAYLELDRRERLGLPLIDPNLVDPAKIQLPSDEELGDFEIHL